MTEATDRYERITGKARAHDLAEHKQELDQLAARAEKASALYKRTRARTVETDPLAFRLKAVRYRARQESIPFNLTIEWAQAMWANLDGMCVYSGLPMRLITDGRHPLGMSLDRVDPGLGYRKGNVVMCCSCMNVFKSDMSMDQFQYVLQQLAEHVRSTTSPAQVPRPNPFPYPLPQDPVR